VKDGGIRSGSRIAAGCAVHVSDVRRTGAGACGSANRRALRGGEGFDGCFIGPAVGPSGTTREVRFLVQP
jgi:hypothetical protein